MQHTPNQYTQWRSWKTGIALVIIMMVIGAAVGFIADKAGATCTDTNGVAAAGSCGTVSSPAQGVQKWKAGSLGRAGKVQYTAHAKKVILDKLMKKQAKQARLARATTRLSRAGMWKNYTSADRCFFRINENGDGPAGWTCSGPFSPFESPWTPSDLHAHICNGVAGLGMSGALATSETGPWTWIGLGAAWLQCRWSQALDQVN